MTEVARLVTSLGEALRSLWGLSQAVVSLLAGHWATVFWLIFWLWLVRWPDFRAELKKGGWLAAALLYFIVALVWGLNSESQFGLPRLTETFLLSAGAVVIAFLCGALQDHWQLTPPVIDIPGPPEVADDHHGHHGGHDDHH